MQLLKTKLGYLLYLIGLIPLIVSCKGSSSSSSLTGNWKSATPYGGDNRAYAVCFNLGDNEYLGLGRSNKTWYSDFWKYNIQTSSWDSVGVDPFKGVPRIKAIAFSINGKGYVGTGIDADGNYLKDFWEFDPTREKGKQWDSIAPFPGGKRAGCVGFSIGNLGYVGTGYDGGSDKGDFFVYNPDNDTWQTLTPGFQGEKRSDASVFIINDKAYIVGGWANGAALWDFYAFDPNASDAANTWTKLRDIKNTSSESYDDNYNIMRHDACAFTSTEGKGYFMLGVNSTIVGTVWEYDPANDLWDQKTSFEKAAKAGACAFTLGGRLFVATGTTGGSSYTYNMDEFEPNVEYNEND